MSKLLQKSQDQRWLMRWVVVITYITVLSTSLVAGIVLAVLKSNPTFLGVPAPFLFAMRPIVDFLFGSKRK